MTGLAVLRLVAVLSTAVAMAGGFAHLLALPNTIGLGRGEYLIAQQIYRGWALLGAAVVTALVTRWLVAFRVRARARRADAVVARGARLGAGGEPGGGLRRWRRRPAAVS